MKKAVTKLRGRRLDSETWSMLLSACEQSELSVKDYCASQGISAASYYRWQKRLGRDKESASDVFRPIEIQTKANSHKMVLELAGGLLLRFEELPPVAYLRSLSLAFSGMER